MFSPLLGSHDQIAGYGPEKNKFPVERNVTFHMSVATGDTSNLLKIILMYLLFISNASRTGKTKLFIYKELLFVFCSCNYCFIIFKYYLNFVEGKKILYIWYLMFLLISFHRWGWIIYCADGQWDHLNEFFWHYIYNHVSRGLMNFIF